MRVLQDYTDKITPWNQQPKFLATVSATLQPFADIQVALANLPYVFDVDYSVGVQEDVDGQWIGRSRDILVQEPISYVACDVIGLGCDTVELYPDGAPRSAPTMVALDDTTYRRLLYAKIVANNWDGQTVNAALPFNTFLGFDSYVVPPAFVQDLCNMTMDFCVAGAPLTGAAIPILSETYLPVKPAGVSANFWYASPGPSIAIPAALLALLEMNLELLPSTKPSTNATYWNDGGILAVTPGGSLQTTIPTSDLVVWDNGGFVCISGDHYKVLSLTGMPVNKSSVWPLWNDGGVLNINSDYAVPAQPPFFTPPVGVANPLTGCDVHNSYMSGCDTSVLAVPAEYLILQPIYGEAQ